MMIHDVNNDHVFQVLVKNNQLPNIGTSRIFCSLQSLKNKQALKFVVEWNLSWEQSPVLI